jgi:hypothetical protein
MDATVWTIAIIAAVIAILALYQHYGPSRQRWPMPSLAA